MKIGIDARLYRGSAAGIGRYSQNLIKNLAEIDSANQYILLMTHEDAVEYESSGAKSSNFEVLETDIVHYSLSEQLNLSKILEAQKCDLWHFLNFNVPVNFKGKYVVTIHDLTLFFYEGRNKKSFIHKLGYKYIFRKACQRANEIIAVSESTKNDVVSEFKIDSNKIKVIYEAADDKMFEAVANEALEQLKTEYQIMSQPIILYVGQWRPHKNLIGLIEAYNNLRQQIEAKLVIVGKIDSAYPEVSETIDKSPNMRDIIKTGFVTEKELAAWYRLATVFVFPSFYEGFGLPGLEAMAAGVPVIASDRTSLPEIYQEGAIYFNPSDSQEIAEKIKQVITDSKLRNELIDKGKTVIKKFSWAKAAQETLEVYQQIKKI